MCERVRPSGDTCGDLTAGAGAPGRTFRLRTRRVPRGWLREDRDGTRERRPRGSGSGWSAGDAAWWRRMRMVSLVSSRPTGFSSGGRDYRFSRFSACPRMELLACLSSQVSGSRGLGGRTARGARQRGDAPSHDGGVDNADRQRQSAATWRCPATNPGPLSEMVGRAGRPARRASSGCPVLQQRGELVLTRACPAPRGYDQRSAVGWRQGNPNTRPSPVKRLGVTGFTGKVMFIVTCAPPGRGRV